VRLAFGRLRRVVRLVAFRPVFLLVLLGSLTLASNVLWFGSGLFIGPLPGVVITLLTGAGLAGALVMLRRGRCQVAALGVFIGFAVLVPAIALIAFRLKTGVPILMHDGAYQTEEAMRALLTNHDPYGLDYTQTSMRRWHWYVNSALHPSLFHYVYPPLTFLLPLPFFAAAQALGLPFDVRLVFLATAGLAVWAIVRLPWRWEWRYLCLVALFLDPFFYLPQGRNDILFLASLVGAVLAWEWGRPVAACAGVGLALACKPFALFFVLLVAVMLLRGRKQEGWSARQLGAGLAALVLPLVVSAAPFLWWNAAAYWDDTVSFVAGTDPHSFPIQGYGLSSLLVALHVLPGPEARFPFGLVEAAVGIPLLVLGVRRVLARPVLPTVLVWGTIVLAAFLFTGRLFNDNYVADLVFLAILSGASRRAAIGKGTRGAEFGPLPVRKAA
jgi:hypothetical protein